MKKRKSRKIAKVSFLFYALILFAVLYFINSKKQYIDQSAIDYAKSKINLIPFKTISEYFSSLGKNTVNPEIATKDLIGNFTVFMPMGFYLPLFMKNVKSNMKYIVTVLVILVCTEILKLIMMSGSFNIDDMILNLAGAMIGYMICQTKAVKKLIKKLK